MGKNVGNILSKLRDSTKLMYCIYLYNGTPLLIAKLVVKFGKIQLHYQLMYLKAARRVANNADPDQMPHSVASDLGLHCLLRPVCPNT